jgi:DNA-binding transcriptional LysR family regulator
MQMKGELNSIPVFVAAVEAGSFSRAAEQLFLTRSAVTKTIARLESRLGVTLFHRTTRSLRLTEQGAIYYDYCRRALLEMEKAEATLAENRLQVNGSLRVSLPVLFGRLCIAPLLTALAREHEGLQLSLSFSDRLVDIVEEGVDLAIRIGELADSSSLVARQIASHGMVFCASPDYLQAFGEPASAEALVHHHAIGYTRGGRVQKWQAGEAEITPTARIMMDDMQALKDAAIAGCGIAWLPYWLVREALEQSMLQEVLPGVNTSSWPVYAVWPQSPHLSLNVRVAVERLQSALPEIMAVVEAPTARRSE